MLKTRILTAFIFICVVVYVMSLAPVSLFYTLFLSFVCLAIFFAGTEYIAMRWNVMDGPTAGEQLSRPQLKIKHFLVGFSYSASILLYCLLTSPHPILHHGLYILPLAWIFLCIFLASALIYRNAIDMHTASNKILNIIAGYIYLVVPGICFVTFAFEHYGTSPYRCGQLYFCLASVFMGDTGAFFIGRSFGKHKLIPRVSPKKTVEGAIGGLVFSALTSMGVGLFFQLPFPLWYLVFCGICIGISGQIGDLMESAFKRAGGFKDSGHILPGHGGFLDRIDSLIFGIPVNFILFTLYHG